MTLKLDWKLYLKVVIMLGIMCAIGSLPTFGQITPLGMKVLGVFAGMIFGWLAIDVLWPSLFGFLALALTGYTTVIGAFGAGLANPTVMMILFSAIFAGAIERTNAIELVNTWLLSQSIIRKNPWFLVFAIMLLAAIGTMLNGGMAVIFLLWVLVLRLADICGYEKKDPLVSFLTIMVVICSITGGNCIPFQAGSLAYLGFFEPQAAAPFAYGPFLLLTLSSLLIFCLMMILLAKFVVKIDVSKLQINDEMLAELHSKKTTSLQKAGLWSMVVFMIIMLAPQALPRKWAIVGLINQLGLIGVTVILLIFFALLRDDQGKPVLSIAACHQSIPWSVIWLLALAMPLSGAIKDEQCGIMATIMDYCAPLFDGMNWYVFMVLAMVFLGLLTQVCNNMVLGAMFIPLFTNICVSLGGNPYVLFIMLFIALNCAYATPAASMQGAMVHGSDAVDKKYAYLWGVLAIAVTCVIGAVITVPLGNLLW